MLANFPGPSVTTKHDEPDSSISVSVVHGEDGAVEVERGVVSFVVIIASYYAFIYFFNKTNRVSTLYNDPTVPNPGRIKNAINH